MKEEHDTRRERGADKDRRRHHEATRHQTADNVHGRHGRGGKGAVEDDQTPYLVDATNRDGVHNHGRVTDPAWMGQEVIEDYGLDRSTMVGKPSAERGPDPAGDCYDLSHSLEGAGRFRVAIATAVAARTR